MGTKRHIVITTNGCVKCKTVKLLAEGRGLLDKIDFIPYSSIEGKRLAKKFNIKSAGVIIDTETGSSVELGDVEGS